MVSIDSVARYWYGPLGVSLEERHQGVRQKKICKKTAHRFLSRNSRRSGIFRDQYYRIQLNFELL